MLDEPLVVVYEAPQATLSEMVKEMLAQAGVPVMEQGELPPQESKQFGPLNGRYAKLVTVESQAPQARRVINELLSAYGRGDLRSPEG